MATPPAAAPAPVAKAPPPKLNPVRVPIPEESVADRVQDFREVLHAYAKPDAVLEAKRCIQCRRPWCVEACPISQDCREYIRLVAEEKYADAARVTLMENPLATSLCKVCYRYCEDACVVKKKGVPIAIRQLKRSSLELGNDELTYVPSAPRNQRVAVVGGGPAGMMAAWELGIRGYGVTVFEEEARVGGLMQTIPAYRMTDVDVQRDRARMKGLDITWVDNRRIGEQESPEKLLDEGYAAVLVSIGTSAHRKLNVPGEELPGVFPALQLLKQINQGKTVTLGRKVVVIGGGDVAMDSIRSAVRLSEGKDVTLIYRRSRSEMPADHEELHGAEEEGIHFLYQRAPLRIVGNGHVEGIEVQSIELGPPDASGRRSPVPVPGSETIVPCDTVIVAVGQKADLRGFSPSLDMRVTTQGWPEGKAPGYATAVPGVFAAGGRSVVYAMGAATTAAEAIDKYLREKRGEPAAARPHPFGGEGSWHLPAGYTQPIRVA
ncbi:MAG TPA: FAD-dependent oxidoreductase [Thermoplasmata archaeon]|nr:FAD-dependent oxidoreductase [Thermoplasmata archaeon]